MHTLTRLLSLVCALLLTGLVVNAQRGGRGGASAGAPIPPTLPNPRLEALKKDVVAEVESRRQLTQQMVDQIFSYSELGFQEYETQKYVTAILENEGFKVQRGVADIPTSWMATWGSGHPVIALGTDIDCVPASNQTPGVLTRKELVPGAPGHGEGHNGGQGLIVTAAVAAKTIMAREHIQGTIVLWPGVAEELLGAKAFFVRAGLFKDVDAVLYSHVGSNFGTSWGDGGGSGMVSVEYSFKGESAHAAIAPWLGKSALDAVELMDVGWNFRREHLRLAQRSHYVISHGGDQPNVVPPDASVWYYFRENDYDHVKQLWGIGDTMAKAAAMMTDTTVDSRVLGSAWPSHGNRPLAEAIQANIIQVGMPQWSEADQQFARALQRARGAPESGLATEVLMTLRGQELIPDEQKSGGASDDIGDITWNVPTATLMFPSNILGSIVHNWTAAIASATPVAHKGATQGAKVHAMTILDLMMRPELVASARDYFDNVQGKQRKYQPLIRPQDKPATWLNKETMEKYKPELRKYYYDSTKYKTYLEQLGVAYPPPMPPTQAGY